MNPLMIFKSLNVLLLKMFNNTQIIKILQL